MGTLSDKKLDIQTQRQDFLKSHTETKNRLDSCVEEVRTVTSKAAKFDEAWRTIEQWQKATHDQMKDLTAQHEQRLTILGTAVESKFKVEGEKRDREILEMKYYISMNERKL